MGWFCSLFQGRCFQVSLIVLVCVRPFSSLLVFIQLVNKLSDLRAAVFRWRWQFGWLLQIWISRSTLCQWSLVCSFGRLRSHHTRDGLEFVWGILVAEADHFDLSPGVHCQCFSSVGCSILDLRHLVRFDSLSLNKSRRSLISRFVIYFPWSSRTLDLVPVL